ncbi:MAG: hypothetical protein IKC32_01405 [Clostridia bacterium]|nr:hypothetical protein [Clostridia bacterium]
MTELETIAYARSFIDKLANGIDPTDGSAIPDGDVVNKVRISRCLFYVSDLLRRVVEVGGINAPEEPKPPKKPKKQSFSLSPEQIESFNYSERPLTATEICNRISAVGNRDGVKRFPNKNLVKWLVILELLEEVVVGDQRVRRPTPAGEEMGISLEEREGPYGSYFVTVYDLDAQHFILDNIEAIVSVDKKEYKAKMGLTNQGKEWLEKDVARLLELFDGGTGIHEIALDLGRAEKAVASRLRKLGRDPHAIRN